MTRLRVSRTHHIVITTVFCVGRYAEAFATVCHRHGLYPPRKDEPPMPSAVAAAPEKKGKKGKKKK